MAERDFWSFVDRSDPKGCWPWTGPINTTGYGCFGRKLAHRVSLDMALGGTLGSLWALHRCDNPPCVNPRHLYAGTSRDNVHDMIARGRAYVPPVRTECSQGHPLAGENLMLVRSPAGANWRRCRICERARKRAADRRRREQGWRRGRPGQQGLAHLLQKTRVTQAEAAGIRALRAAGTTWAEIARITGRSNNAIARALSEAS